MTNFANFINQDTFYTLSTSERLVTALFVTMLGMGITFVALVSIWGLTVLMSKVLTSFDNKNKIAAAATVSADKPSAHKVEAPVAAAAPAQEEDENLIAVLTAAIAASLNTSMHNIVVRNVRPIPDQTPLWSRAGRTEQMNTRF